MSDFIQPYNNDTSVGLLATPINTSTATRIFLTNLPLYRKGLSPLLRGLEVGMAHGYFLIGPFTKLGPLRNSEYATVIGFIATTGLILILTLAMVIYGFVTYQDESKLKNDQRLLEAMIFSRTEWNQFTSGFFIGSTGGAGFVFIILRFLLKI